MDRRTDGRWGGKELGDLWCQGHYLLSIGLWPQNTYLSSLIICALVYIFCGIQCCTHLLLIDAPPERSILVVPHVRALMSKMFRLRAVDMFVLPQPATHIASHPSNRVQIARQVSSIVQVCFPRFAAVLSRWQSRELYYIHALLSHH